MTELILTALRRRGKPGTAGEIVDIANGLAVEAAWPKRYWARSAQQAVAVLKRLETNGQVEKAGLTRENGMERPMWQPKDGCYDSRAPLPDPPATAEKNHPVDTLTRAQLCAIFDVHSDVVFEATRQQQALIDFVSAQTRQFSEVINRAKRQLEAHGLPAA